MQKLKVLVCSVLAAALVGCASMGVPQPQTLNQKIAVAVVSATEARAQAFNLLAVNKITKEDAVNIQAQADNVVAAAQIAKTLAASNPQAAEAKLQQTRAILAALQAYLIAREGK